MAKEVWRDIPGYEGRYQVSDLGRVRRVLLPNLGGKNKNGYVQVYLPDGGVRYGHSNGKNRHGNRAFVHRLVAATFLGLDLSSGLEVNHLDGNRSNNRVLNLELVTRSGNIRHAHTLPWRKPLPAWKLGRANWNAIRKLYATGAHTHRSLAAMFGVSPGAVRHVLKSMPKGEGQHG